MYPRTNYEMTEADLDKILDACKPTIAIWGSGGVPFGGSPQENANRAWAELGSRMGFDAMTVEPRPGMGNRYFTAVPSENETQREEREARESEERRQSEIKRIMGLVDDLQKQLSELHRNKVSARGGK